VQRSSLIRDGSVPWRELWLNKYEVGLFIGYAPRYVAETLMKDPSFPVPASHGKTLLWKAGEIEEWMQSRRRPRVGRKRKTTP
jgi:hypothetical protein